jgi:hypothetical protein
MLNPADIEFPVYPLREYESILRGSKGAIFIKDKLGDIYLIDDTSKEGTFGQRRLKIKLELARAEAIKLYKLSKSLNNWAAMLSNLRKVKSKTYIDNNGNIFKYSPSVNVPLRYYEIKKVQSIEGKHSYLILNDLHQKIKICRPPPKKCTWAGILLAPTGYLLYSYAEQKLPDTYRKV